MKAYLTKDKQGIVQLWNNNPEYNYIMDCWQGWIKRGFYNEVPVDVTFENSPKVIEL